MGRESGQREALTPVTCVRARDMIGWTQADLAVRSGLTLDTVANFESRRHQPRHHTITALLRAFGGKGVVFVMQADEAHCLRLEALEPAFIPSGEALNGGHVERPPTRTRHRRVGRYRQARGPAS